MMMKDLTAVQLADALDDMHNFPHNTGGLSMLDEATTAYRHIASNLEAAQLAFARARDAHKRSAVGDGYSDDAWQAAMEAGRRLAVLLRELGDFRIDRCTRTTGWGVCRLPLDPDGVCRSSVGHTD